MRNVRHAMTLALCSAALAGWTVRATAQQPLPDQPQLTIGDAAPDFTLQASDGQTYTLSKLKGKTVILAWFPKAFTGG